MTEATNASQSWLKLMGLEIGQEVMILPLAGAPGQGLQGELVELAVNQTGPLLVMIRRSPDTPVVNVPWTAIMMITRPSAPAVPVEQKPVDDVSMEQLIEMAEKMGVAVPADIRDAAAAK